MALADGCDADHWRRPEMVMLSVLGEYLWRALDESRGRPRYIIERRADNEPTHVPSRCA
jgi:hypothetical protein